MPTWNMTVELKGTKELKAVLTQFGAQTAHAMAGALYREGERIMAESKAEVPVDTGALRGSGHVTLPIITPQGAEVTLGYGNSSVGYAVWVHERLDLHHPTGKSKFLEDPVNRARRGMDQRLAADLKKDMERFSK